ncbi:MAG: asparagine synthase-related protein, partial [Bacillota bacterium]
VFNMPDSFKINNNTLKYGLKQVARKYYSDSFVNRKKAGFTMPVKSWIYNDLRDEIQKLGSGEITKYICSGKICELINQHYAGIKDNAMKIWNLYTLELWLKTFFSEQKAGGKDEANSSEL